MDICTMHSPTLKQAIKGPDKAWHKHKYGITPYCFLKLLLAHRPNQASTVQHVNGS